MVVPTPSKETVQIETFMDVLDAEFEVPTQGIITASYIVTDLVAGIERGGVGVTYRHITTRFASAQVIGKLSSTASSLVQLGLERSLSPREKFWEMSYLNFGSGLPGFEFNLDFFGHTDVRSLDIQGERVDLDPNNVDYAREQTSAGLKSFFSLLEARRRACNL